MIPQLAAAIGPKFSRFPCYVQPKLNGVRCLCQIFHGEVIFASREEKLWHPTKLAHLSEQILQIKDVVGDCILDGELYVHGWKLQRINGAVSVKSATPREDTHEVEYHIFDTVQPKSFSQRCLELQEMFYNKELPNVKRVETDTCNSREDLERYFHHYTSLGYEGVMLRPDGPYVYGQTLHGTRKNSEYLWKYKAWEDGEFECVDVTQGEGKADIGIGALICKAHVQLDWTGIRETFHVGTGFDDSERVALMQNPPIGKLIKVRWVPPLSKDGIPNPASFLAVLD